MLFDPSIGAVGMKSQPESERSRGSPGCTKKPIKKRTRQYPRTKVFMPVVIFPRGQQIKGRIIDLSLTGAFILIPELLDLTCPVELLIEIPNMYVLFVIAAIVRLDVRPVGDGCCHRYGLGVHFSNISDEDRRALSSVLVR
jgi:c-di-GMP-binding flagellar brake protein YcgR